MRRRKPQRALKLYVRCGRQACLGAVGSSPNQIQIMPRSCTEIVAVAQRASRFACWRSRKGVGAVQSCKVFVLVYILRTQQLAADA